MSSLAEIKEQLSKTQQALNGISEAIDMLEPLPVETDVSLAMGTPTDEQLSKMNRYRPVGSAPYARDEVVTVPIKASHNLIQLSGLMAWHPDAIKAMATMLIDRPHIVDHEWDEVGGTIGFFYDSQVLSSDSAPAADMAMNGHYDLNQQIVSKYG
jgi:hypothetical protein